MRLTATHNRGGAGRAKGGTTLSLRQSTETDLSLGSLWTRRFTKEVSDE
jgi:hypothetical protein